MGSGFFKMSDVPGRRQVRINPSQEPHCSGCAVVTLCFKQIIGELKEQRASGYSEAILPLAPGEFGGESANVNGSCMCNSPFCVRENRAFCYLGNYGTSTVLFRLFFPS